MSVLPGRKLGARPRVHGFNPALCKVSDEALHATELREWGSVATACDRLLADLVRVHGPARQWIEQKAKRV
jgi:hypothetical protein